MGGLPPDAIGMAILGGVLLYGTLFYGLWIAKKRSRELIERLKKHYGEEVSE